MCDEIDRKQTLNINGAIIIKKSFLLSFAKKYPSKNIKISWIKLNIQLAYHRFENLFKNLKDNPNSSISNALNMTMLNMSKNEKDRSHPMFWAPFVVVGKNEPLFFR